MTHDYPFDASTLVGSPPFFYASKERLIQLPAYFAIEDLNETEKEFVASVITACAESPQRTCDHEAVMFSLADKNLPNSKALIQKRILELRSYGLLDGVDVKRDGKRTAKVYVVCSPRTSSNHKVQYLDHRAQRANLFKVKTDIVRDENVFTLLSELNPNKIKHDAYFTGLFDSAMRSNVKDPRQSITTKLRFMDDYITIKSDVLSTRDLMLLSDQRYVRAVLSLAAQMVEQDMRMFPEDWSTGKRTISQKFIFDIADICQILSKTPTGSSRESARTALERIHATKFEISCTPSSGAYNRLNAQLGLFGDNAWFTFFTEFEIANHQSSLIDSELYRKPRFYQVQFHSYIIECLKNTEVRRSLASYSRPAVYNQGEPPAESEEIPREVTLFTSHPDILRYPSGIIQSFYNYCRLVPSLIRKLKLESHTVSLLELHHSKFSMFRNYRTFVREFDKAMSPFLEQRNGVIAQYDFLGTHVTRFDAKSGNEIKLVIVPQDKKSHITKAVG
jgi:hypothetical protein